MRALLGAAALLALVAGAPARAQLEGGEEARERRMKDLEKWHERRQERPVEAKPPSRAAPAAAPVRRDHVGLYFRPDLGLGYMRTTVSSGVRKEEASGIAGTLGLHLGGAVSKNLLVGAHFYDAVLASPKLVQDGRSATVAPGTTIGIFALGPEVTWYFMPSNTYVAATVALSRLATQVYGQSYTTSAGLGARLALGREWWASERWGLGVVANVTWASNSSNDAAGTAYRYTSWAGGLSFSATYD